jgi:trimeric autotransporter adhesin
MKNTIKAKETTTRVRNSSNRSLWRRGPAVPVLFLAILAFSFFVLLPPAQAVSPPPDGGYPGGNTAEGTSALLSRTTGNYNTAVGIYSLLSLTDGNFCTGVGAGALLSNTAGQNTATGAGALLSNTTGDSNTANGAFTLFSNTIGLGNTATGFDALFSNTEGAGNTATGYQALYSNTAGGANTANGTLALHGNTTGIVNTASGDGALLNNTGGAGNTANGGSALSSNSTGNNNTALGYNAGFNITGSGNVCIGEGVLGDAGVFNTTWIRNIHNTVQPVVGTDPDNVTVNSAGRLGRGDVSSRRYKHDIKPMDNASEAILALKPVTFRYNKEYDATQTLAYGLIAEDVAQVYPDLVGRNREGQPESVRYEQINAMLLNEFLKAHRKMEEQQKQIDALTAQLKEQDAQIQKVSAQVKMSRPAQQVAMDQP